MRQAGPASSRSKRARPAASSAAPSARRSSADSSRPIDPCAPSQMRLVPPGQHAQLQRAALVLDAALQLAVAEPAPFLPVQPDHRSLLDVRGRGDEPPREAADAEQRGRGCQTPEPVPGTALELAREARAEGTRGPHRHVGARQQRAQVGLEDVGVHSSSPPRRRASSSNTRAKAVRARVSVDSAALALLLARRASSSVERPSTYLLSSASR